MPMKKDLKLDQYDISPYAYRELHNFCLQYPEKKRRLRELESPFGGPRGSDPTAGRATRAATLAADIALIEKRPPGGGRAGPLSGGGGDRGHALALPAHAQGPARWAKKASTASAASSTTCWPRRSGSCEGGYWQSNRMKNLVFAVIRYISRALRSDCPPKLHKKFISATLFINQCTDIAIF